MKNKRLLLEVSNLQLTFENYRTSFMKKIPIEKCDNVII